MANPRTIVVILHYRGVEDTLACLRSVLPQQGDTLGVLLVDNGSADQIVEALGVAAMQVDVLRLAANQGWAGGNNAGIRWAREHGASAVCLLNNDTVVPDRVFINLAAVLDRFGPCLLHPAIDYADPAQGAQLNPSLSPNTVPVSGWETLYPMHYAYGACLFVPMTVFDRIGLFDERFFLQLEEADFYERARRSGIPAVCDVSVRILHSESRTFGGRVTPDKTYYIIRNSFLLAAKNYRDVKLAVRIIQRAYWTSSTVLRIGEQPSFGAIFRRLITDDPHAVAIKQAIGDFCLMRFGARRP
jgi:GT2 family glycosyltransferase